MEIIELVKQAERDIKKIPRPIRDKFFKWVVAVEYMGIKEVRKIPGYHDEPLRGDRKGQRSIRLSRSYRAIYIEIDKNKYVIIEVQEINKHDY